MVEVIPAKTLLAIVLSKTESVPCKILINIRNSIEKKYSDIVVDVSRNSILGAQRRYPYLFKIQECPKLQGYDLQPLVIKRAKDFSELPPGFLEREFFNPIDKDVFDRIKREVNNYPSIDLNLS